MAVTIDRFISRCHVFHRVTVDVNSVARELFPVYCARNLNSDWQVQPNVVRIRRLIVALKVSSERLTGERLAEAWAEAFARELFAALACANRNATPNVATAESRAGWLVKVIRDLLAGTAASRWEYDEFKKLFGLGTAEAILTLLGNEASEALPTLLTLRSHGVLQRLLLLFDELGMERLFVIIASGLGVSETRLLADDLLMVGDLVPVHEVRNCEGQSRRSKKCFASLFGDRTQPWYQCEFSLVTAACLPPVDGAGRIARNQRIDGAG